MRERRPFLTLSFAIEHSLALPLSAAIALAWANVLPVSYTRVADALGFAVNQVGMAFFFALAAKEIVEATAPGGALPPVQTRASPIAS